jgi:hypothetical protein
MTACASFRRASLHTGSEATAERRERGFELFEAGDVVAVEDMGDLFRRPAQPSGQLRRVEPGLTHRAVEFELGGGQGGEPRHWAPLRRGRSRNVFVVGDHPKDRFLEHVLCLTQRLLEGVALRRPIPDIRESDDIPPSSSGSSCTG